MRRKNLIFGMLVAALAVGLMWFGCSKEKPVAPELTQRTTPVLNAALAKADAGGRVFVVFDGRPDPTIVESAGGQVVYTYHLVPAIAATGPAEVISQIAAHPRVIRIEPDGEVHAIDAELDNSWGVKRIGAGTVHDGGNKGTGVKVGVIDSGTDYEHPDLDDNFDISLRGYDFVNNDNDPMDDAGHGTHVAGTVAARDDDNGVVGVAPEASLFALKVLDATGSGKWSDVIAALDWCVENGIQVTNNSYGSRINPGGTVKAAFDNAAAAGILHVAAAGNSGNPRGKGNNVEYPARFESVIAVAATDKNDQRTSFSSTGDAVELAAPGVDINSTKLGGGYIKYSGTSMASPHVAGTAALVWAAYPSWSNVDVRTQLQNAADDLGDPGRDPKYGYGLVDAAEAAGAPPNDPPTVTITKPVDASTFDSGAMILFEGTATDPEDGGLTANLVWTSNIDGPIGTGGSFSTTLSDGNHTITAQVTDSGGKTGSASISITVGSPLPGDANDIYVWAIDFSEKHYGKGGSKTDLMTTVTIRRDSDADGTADNNDERVSKAQVEMRLSKDTGESWNFVGDTGDDGTVTFTLKFASKGTYTASVTNVTHSTYTYNSSLNVETSDSHTI